MDRCPLALAQHIRAVACRMFHPSLSHCPIVFRVFARRVTRGVAKGRLGKREVLSGYENSKQDASTYSSWFPKLKTRENNGVAKSYQI